MFAGWVDSWVESWIEGRTMSSSLSHSLLDDDDDDDGSPFPCTSFCSSRVPSPLSKIAVTVPVREVRDVTTVKLMML